jgi:hypothetical protein
MTTNLSNEEIEMLIPHCIRGDDERLANALRELLALREASKQPVGFRCRRNDGLGEWSYIYHRAPDAFDIKHLMIEYLYTAPQPAVVPDGWKLVPIEPTENMVVSGFESEPDSFFSDPDEWRAYKAMSGCQQAAHKAKLCWAAMLDAAPQVK